MRINRFLAQAGLGSRRSCEQFVLDGRVEVNGNVVRVLSTQIGEKDKVHFDGELVTAKRSASLALHKPPGAVTSKRDERNRQTVYDFLPEHLKHLAYAGRLDRESEGLLIFSNDGDLLQRLGHPRFQVEKEYEVYIDKRFRSSHRQQLIRQGIPLEEGLAKALNVDLIAPRIIRITLSQGWNRQIRRMLGELDIEVKRLIRIRIGPVKLADLMQKRWRYITESEVASLGKGMKPSSKK